VTLTAFAGIQPVDLPAIVAATRTGFFFERRAFLRRFRFVCDRTQAASFFAPEPIRDFERFDILGFRFFAIYESSFGFEQARVVEVEDAVPGCR
jgi:hypothetical protein